MTTSRERQSIFRLALLLSSWLICLHVCVPTVCGQDVVDTTGESSSTADPQLTQQDIDAGLKAIQEATDLEDDVKAELTELYSQASQLLSKAAEQQKQAAIHSANIESASADIEKASQAKDSISGYDFAKAANLDLNQLNKDRGDLEQHVQEAKQALLDAQAEPQRRVARQTEIVDELSAANESLAEVEEKLKALSSDAPPTLALAAQKAVLQANKQALKNTITRLENERDSYEAQGELPRLNIDLATARLKQLEQDALKLVEVITKRRKSDAREQVAAANQALENAPVAFQPLAKKILIHANDRLDLAAKIAVAAKARDQTNQQLARWTEEFERTKKRADAASSDSVGLLLVERRSELPSISVLRRAIDDSNSEIRDYQQDLYELEDRRQDLADVSGDVEKSLEELRKKGAQLPADAATQLENLFLLELQILDSLLKDAERNYSLRILARQDQQKLVDVIIQYREYIDTKILWVRSAPPLRPSHLSDSHQAISWLLNPATLWGIGDQLTRRFFKYPIRLILASLGLLLLCLLRPRMRSLLKQLADQASTVSCHTLRPTGRAILVTVLLAGTGPLLVWGASYLLSGAVTSQVRGFADALYRTSLWYLSFELIRQLWRANGLADAHFAWAREARPAVQVFARHNLLFGIPLAFLSVVFQRHGDPVLHASLGRISFIALLLLIAITSFRLFRPESKFFTSQLIGKRVQLIRRCLFPICVLVPIALGLLAANGFHYTADQLAVRLLYSFMLVIDLLVIKALLFRWVRVTRRRLRWQQLTEARERSTSEESSEARESAALTAKEAETDLVVMDRQTRQLITMVIAVVGLLSISWIWLEVVQAIAPFLQQPVYYIQVSKGVFEPIIVGSVLFSLLVVGITVAAWRNIPGLVDVFLLGRMGIESAIRYAISTMLQYAIGITGAVIALGALGFTWDRMQWLVAAMGVGLGFGLQEIVANFVSGVILLFERPIRVGDVVTLGDTTGVVVRIRSRATTVRNWDRQEVVIPNKELITGRITNWTLSDQLNRVVLTVGIAYGSDTEHARNVILEIMRENPDVLEDPVPGVTFEQFGDSTLNLVVRAFLKNLDNRLKTINDLHNTIYRRFNDENIEIAFPQRDLHIRSIDNSINLLDPKGEETWAESKTNPGD